MELVIVIAIVIILSVVSVPIYRGYTRNAKMAEGYALLGVILSAQKAYYSQYGNFLRDGNSSGGNNIWTCSDIVLGIDARGNKYFSLFDVCTNDIGAMSGRLNPYVLILPELRIGGNSILALYFDLNSGSSSFKEINDAAFTDPCAE